MDILDVLYESAYKEQYARDKTKIHLKVEENTTLCMKMGDRTGTDIWGELLTAVMTQYVGCPKCIEGMHS